MSTTNSHTITTGPPATCIIDHNLGAQPYWALLIRVGSGPPLPVKIKGKVAARLHKEGVPLTPRGARALARERGVS